MEDVGGGFRLEPCVGACLGRWGCPLIRRPSPAITGRGATNRGAALVHVANSPRSERGLSCSGRHASIAVSAWELVEVDERRREKILSQLVEDVIRETERERALFAEFRGSQEV
jgi:hypothetical protein